MIGEEFPVYSGCITIGFSLLREASPNKWTKDLLIKGFGILHVIYGEAAHNRDPAHP